MKKQAMMLICMSVVLSVGSELTHAASDPRGRLSQLEKEIKELKGGRDSIKMLLDHAKNNPDSLLIPTKGGHTRYTKEELAEKLAKKVLTGEVSPEEVGKMAASVGKVSREYRAQLEKTLKELEAEIAKKQDEAARLRRSIGDDPGVVARIPTTKKDGSAQNPDAAPLLGKYLTYFWSQALFRPGGSYRNPELRNQPTPIIMTFDQNGNITGRCKHELPQSGFRDYRKSYQNMFWRISLKVSGKADWDTGKITFKLTDVKIKNGRQSSKSHGRWSGDIYDFDATFVGYRIPQNTPHQRSFYDWGGNKGGAPNMTKSPEGEWQIDDSGWLSAFWMRPYLEIMTLGPKDENKGVQLTYGKMARYAGDKVTDYTADRQKTADEKCRTGVHWFLKIVKPLEEEKIGVAFVPHTSGGEKVEQQLFKAMGGIKEIDQIHAIGVYLDFFNTLEKIRKTGKKIEFLVIAAHGVFPGEEPNIRLGSEDMLLCELDLHNYLIPALRRDKIVLRRKRQQMNKADIEGYEYRIFLYEEVIPRIPKISEGFTKDAKVLLINCSSAGSERGVKLVKNMGRVLMGKRGGMIMASKRQIFVNTIPSILPDWFMGKFSEIRYIRHGKGDISKAGGLIFNADWVKFRIPPNTEIKAKKQE